VAGRGRGWLLAAGAVAAAQMIAVVLADGATRAGYDPYRNWVSQLSLGPRGWLGSANMALCGAWLLAYAVGLRRLARTATARRAARLVACCGAGFVVVAVVPIDPGIGYPPGLPAVHTTTGYLHQAAAIALLTAGAAASVLLGRCLPEVAWAARAGVAVAVAMVLSFVAAAALVTLDLLGVAPGAPSGLLERVALFAGLGWLGVAGLCLLRAGATGTSTPR
jgi:hypothetical protein